MKTICLKCQNPFSEKKLENIINLLSAELAQRVVKVNKDDISSKFVNLTRFHITHTCFRSLVAEINDLLTTIYRYY